jgi:hypothetical protein
MYAMSITFHSRLENLKDKKDAMVKMFVDNKAGRQIFSTLN